MGDWRDFYRKIHLTDEERDEAILQGQIKKHFKLKNAPYWEEKEKWDTSSSKSEHHREQKGKS